MTRLAAQTSRILIASLLFAACGDDGPAKTPDARPADSAPRVCTAVTAGADGFIDYDETNMFAEWGALVTGDLGDGNKLQLQFEFYGGIETSLAGTFQLAAGKQANYETCAICVRAFDVAPNGDIVKQFFQSGGSITLTEDPLTNVHMIASFTDLQLEEVTINSSTYHSTPVAGGACTSFANFNIDRDNVPPAWTCTHDKYDDGANCDCMCGVNDPDCSIPAAPVVGCPTVGQVCFNDACVTPPTNDTCGALAPIVVGTPVTGSTAGAANNYNLGLEGATCTNTSQAGPDVAYTLDLTAGQAITVTLSGLPTTYDASVALLGPGLATICDASPITTCVAGADAGSEGVTETFNFTATDLGTYFILVDSFYPDQGGAFTLSVVNQ